MTRGKILKASLSPSTRAVARLQTARFAHDLPQHSATFQDWRPRQKRPPPPPLQKSRSLQERARRAPTAPTAEEEGEEGAGEAEGAAGPSTSASRSSSGDARRNQPDPSSLERLLLRRRRARRGQRPLPPAEHLVSEPWTASAMEASDPADCIRLAAAAAAFSRCPSRPRPRWRAMTPAPPRVVGGTWPVSLFLHD